MRRNSGGERKASRLPQPVRPLWAEPVISSGTYEHDISAERDDEEQIFKRRSAPDLFNVNRKGKPLVSW